MKKIITRIVKNIEAIILPYTCILCLAKSTLQRDLCDACYDELPWLNHCCTQCALPLIQTNKSLICGNCLKNSPAFDQTIALFSYEMPVDRFIQYLKFQKNLLYARLLGEIFTEKIQSTYKEKKIPQCIIPIPLHKKRLRERGFNQSIELARPISKTLDIPILANACRRIRHTEAQSSIPSSARKKNVKNAFSIHKKVPYTHIALIDDVMTTGNTANECSIVLKKHGIQKIDVWCFTRTSS